MSSVIVWGILLAGFLVIEAVTTALVTIWFAAGSLAGLLAALLGAPAWVQIMLFVLVSAGLLLLLRPMLHGIGKKSRTNTDAVIGTQGYVTEDIDNNAAAGRVRLGSMTWSARSADGAPISTGTLVRADRIEGVKVFVTPVADSK